MILYTVMYLGQAQFRGQNKMIFITEDKEKAELFINDNNITGYYVGRRGDKSDYLRIETLETNTYIGIYSDTRLEN